jgi:aryl-alcohol dehydrogenase-like predicted oxidoreductase
VLTNPIVFAPIVGATKPHHLTDAAAAVAITLTKDEVGMAAFVGARSRPSRPWPT